MALKPAWRLSLFAIALALVACANGKGTVRAGDPAGPDTPVAAVATTDPARLLEVDRQAATAYANGQYERAVELYHTLAESVPGEPEYWYRLGNALARTGHPNDAAIAYEQVLVREPDNARAWYNLGVVRLRQAQASFAEGVKSSRAGAPEFDESLRLSTAIFSLTATDAQRQAEPQTSIRQQPTE